MNRGSSSVTILNPIKNQRGDVLEWRPTVLDGVHIERKHAAAESGAESLKQTTIIIWKQIVTQCGLCCVSKNVLNKSVDGYGMFALSVGDYIVPGTCQDVPEAGKPMKAFIQSHDVLQIVSVEELFYGNTAMQHWEVTAK